MSSEKSNLIMRGNVLFILQKKSTSFNFAPHGFELGSKESLVLPVSGSMIQKGMIEPLINCV